MPRTKLGQGFKDSSKNTQSVQPAESDDLMADFQMPDDLRKDLGYPANVKKRQARVDHVDKKLTERLDAINARLKEDNVKVSIKRQDGSLVLIATLPLKPSRIGKVDKPNEQTPISLGIPFNLDGLKTAEEEARELGKLKARQQFQWNEKYLRTQAPKPEVVPTIGELLEQFEEKYFLTRKRNRQSENTYSNYSRILSRHGLRDELFNKTTIKKMIERTPAGTGDRQVLVNALSVLCNIFDFEFNFKGYKDGYKPKKRILPTDKEIEDKFNNFKPTKYNRTSQWQQWQWVYGMLATYGLRPHEVFAIDIESFIDPANVLHELKLDEATTEGIKTGERTVFPLHPEWVELFDLKNVKIPKLTNNFKAKTSQVGRRFLGAKIGFPPYNLRHAYAVRGHELGVPIKEMADNMGHSVDMHTTTYQKYMTIDSRRIVYQNAMNRVSDAKVELTKVEQLEAENAALKAENESLRALLVKHQLGELLNNQ